jgi:hypothetical protein
MIVLDLRKRINRLPLFIVTLSILTLWISNRRISSFILQVMERMVSKIRNFCSERLEIVVEWYVAGFAYLFESFGRLGQHSLRVFLSVKMHRVS